MGSKAEMTVKLNGKVYSIFENTYTQSIGECERKYFEFKYKYGNAACNLYKGIYRIFGFTFKEIK